MNAWSTARRIAQARAVCPLCADVAVPADAVGEQAFGRGDQLGHLPDCPHVRHLLRVFCHGDDAGHGGEGDL